MPAKDPEGRKGSHVSSGIQKTSLQTRAQAEKETFSGTGSQEGRGDASVTGGLGPPLPTLADKAAL